MNPFFHSVFSISDSLKSVRESALNYETIIVLRNVLEGGFLIKGIRFSRVRCFWLLGMYLLIRSPSNAVRSGNEITIPYGEVNISCAEIKATGF